MAVCHESAIEVVKRGQDCFRNPLTAEKRKNAPIPMLISKRTGGSGTA